MNLKNRYPYWYLERASISRQDGLLVAQSATRDRLEVPLASIGFLLLGPGCRISSNALSLAARSGGHIAVSSSSLMPTAVITTRASHGSGQVAAKQARTWASPAERLEAAKKFMSMKFPEAAARVAAVSRVRDLTGVEGPIMRDIYRRVFGSSFRRVREDGGDRINHLINVLYNATYNQAAVVCIEMGLSPHLGLVHGEKRHAFVYDLADLIKDEELLQLAADESQTFGNMLNAAARLSHRTRAWERMTGAVRNVFNLDEKEVEAPPEIPDAVRDLLPSEDADEDRDDDIEL